MVKYSEIKRTLVIGFFSFLVVVLTIFSIESANAQDVALRYGTGVPAAVRIINDRGLRYLANSQMEDGGWSGAGSGPGCNRDLRYGTDGEWRRPGFRSLCHEHP